MLFYNLNVVYYSQIPKMAGSGIEHSIGVGWDAGCRNVVPCLRATSQV